MPIISVWRSSQTPIRISPRVPTRLTTRHSTVPTLGTTPSRNGTWSYSVHLRAIRTILALISVPKLMGINTGPSVHFDDQGPVFSVAPGCGSATPPLSDLGRKTSGVSRGMNRPQASQALEYRLLVLKRLANRLEWSPASARRKETWRPESVAPQFARYYTGSRGLGTSRELFVFKTRSRCDMETLGG